MRVGADTLKGVGFFEGEYALRRRLGGASPQEVHISCLASRLASALGKKPTPLRSWGGGSSPHATLHPHALERPPVVRVRKRTLRRVSLRFGSLSIRFLCEQVEPSPRSWNLNPRVMVTMRVLFRILPACSRGNKTRFHHSLDIRHKGCYITVALRHTKTRKALG
jgi:hypothetical protein